MSVKQKGLSKKLSALMFVFVAFTISATALSSYAAINNNIDYEFTILANGKVNKNSISQYRSTTNTRNSWKVNLKDSSESQYGTNTYTNFHLGIKNDYGINPKGSNSYKVLEGSGSHYYAAYQDASQKYVYLYGYDNMNTNSAYDVSGYWGEETGNHPD